MYTTNRVQLTGNLGSDPEIKSFGNGNKLAKFSLAIRDEYTTRTGEKASNTHWINVAAWSKLADKVEAECKKGSFVSVEGRIITRNYTDKNGVKRYATEIVATDVVLNLKKEQQAA